MSSALLKMIAGRLASAALLLLLVAAVTFALIHAAPGGPFASDRAVSAEVEAALNAQYRLDQPLPAQFFAYLGQALQGNFGPSYRYPGRTVSELIIAGLPATLELACYALLLALLIGIVAGSLAARRPGSAADQLSMGLALLGICLPAFVLGPLLVLVFGVYLEWLPVSGWGELAGDKWLPTVTLAAGYCAYIARLTRAGLRQQLSQPYIITARSKGLSELAIIVHHALRGALLPVVAYLGPACAGLIAGSFVVETIFQIPGIGRFYIQAAFNRDYTLIMALTLFFAALIIFFNLLADLVALWLDPRQREALS